MKPLACAGGSSAVVAEWAEECGEHLQLLHFSVAFGLFHW